MPKNDKRPSCHKHLKIYIYIKKSVTFICKLVHVYTHACACAHDTLYTRAYSNVLVDMHNFYSNICVYHCEINFFGFSVFCCYIVNYVSVCVFVNIHVQVY